ncbi:MAG TPA: response regulator [Luteitalea sp.]|nr:response regulator [Luteitalea sp.]
MGEPIRSVLRVLIADDEEPARGVLKQLLEAMPDVRLVAEAADGVEAVTAIEREMPDLALLDLQMPELDGLGVVRAVRQDRLPLFAFVTAYDAYAVKAFEARAIDYLLKPVEPSRLFDTLQRARDLLEHEPVRQLGREQARRVAQVQDELTQPPLQRIPVRRRDDILLLPVAQIASVVADGELMHVTTLRGETFVVTHRLKDLETRLPVGQFVRVERGAIINVDAIARVSPLPGAVYLIALTNGQELRSSRLQSRVLRDRLLKL